MPMIHIQYKSHHARLTPIQTRNLLPMGLTVSAVKESSQTPTQYTHASATRHMTRLTMLVVKNLGFESRDAKEKHKVKAECPLESHNSNSRLVSQQQEATEGDTILFISSAPFPEWPAVSLSSS